jgi:penicillin-binding protein 1C
MAASTSSVDSHFNFHFAFTEAHVPKPFDAFASFGNQGQPLRPYAIARMSLPRQGDGPSVRIRPEQASEPAAPVFSPEIAALVFDVLSDPDARRPMFGSTAPMSLPFKVALKTGTTRGFTDNIALGSVIDLNRPAWGHE